MAVEDSNSVYYKWLDTFIQKGGDIIIVWNVVDSNVPNYLDGFLIEKPEWHKHETARPRSSTIQTFFLAWKL
jgi:hypothetical protein